MPSNRDLSLVILVILACYASHTISQRAIHAGDIPAEDQDYDFGPDHRCRLLAHTSVILENDNHHILVVDSGFGIFRTQIGGEEVRVYDLNPYTVAFNLSEDFSSLDPGPTPQRTFKKPYDNPDSKFQITSLGSIWSSADQNLIWHQGGQYYNGPDWRSSEYHVEKDEIPDWQLWEFDVRNWDAGWKDVTHSVSGYHGINRTFAGAAACVSELSTCYHAGGLITSTTSAYTANGSMQSTSKMIIFKEQSRLITTQSISVGDTNDGYWRGKLIHLPIGKTNGYLMSMMSLKYPTNQIFTDSDGESSHGEDSTVTAVKLDAIPFYDVETGLWFTQNTSWINNEQPEPRTRFCAVLFRNEVDDTWDLWLHGGQRMSDFSGVPDIYVLSMPSFIWTKLSTDSPQTNEIRSHTCHALGGQLLVVGGYPAGTSLGANASCDAQYLKVLNIGADELTWNDGYIVGSKYRSPRKVRETVQGNRTPFRVGFANKKLEEAFRHREPSPPPVGTIVGIVISVVAAVALLSGLVFLYWRRRRHQRKAIARNDNAPPSPAGDQPEVACPEHLTVTSQRSTSIPTISEVKPDFRSQQHELEGSVPTQLFKEC